MSGILQLLTAGGVDPHTADSLFSSVVFFAHMNGADGSTDCIDVKGHTVAVNNFTISTAQSKFGGASGFYNSSSNSRNTLTHADLDLGTGDWSIDFWFRASAVTGDVGIFQLTSALYPGTYSPLSVLLVGGNIALWHNGGYTAGATALSTGTWYHVEVTRNGGTVTLYLNGTSETTRSADTMAGYQHLTIGASNSTVFDYDGWIDNFRITKGVARHTANFTPPTNEFN